MFIPFFIGNQKQINTRNTKMKSIVDDIIGYILIINGILNIFACVVLLFIQPPPNHNEERDFQQERNVKELLAFWKFTNGAARIFAGCYKTRDAVNLTVITFWLESVYYSKLNILHSLGAAIMVLLSVELLFP
jgi:hypothetical protein